VLNPDFFSFTVTGTMEERRKDFSQLFEAVQLLVNDQDFNIRKIRIVMLGGLLIENNKFGLDMIKRAKEFNSIVNFELFKLFEEKFIEETTYRNYIAQTNCILNPLNLESYKHGKFCSGMSECISHSLPGLYPAKYEILDELNTSSVKYSDSNELYLSIKKIVTDKSYYNSLIKEAKENSKNFSIENIRSEMNQFLNSI
jgi:hypothetical protein